MQRCVATSSVFQVQLVGAGTWTFLRWSMICLIFSINNMYKSYFFGLDDLTRLPKQLLHYLFNPLPPQKKHPKFLNDWNVNHKFQHCLR